MTERRWIRRTPTCARSRRWAVAFFVRRPILTRVIDRKKSNRKITRVRRYKPRVVFVFIYSRTRNVRVYTTLTRFARDSFSRIILPTIRFEITRLLPTHLRLRGVALPPSPQHRCPVVALPVYLFVHIDKTIARRTSTVQSNRVRIWRFAKYY